MGFNHLLQISCEKAIVVRGPPVEPCGASPKPSKPLKGWRSARVGYRVTLMSQQLRIPHAEAVTMVMLYEKERWTYDRLAQRFYKYSRSNIQSFYSPNLPILKDAPVPRALAELPARRTELFARSCWYGT